MSLRLIALFSSVSMLLAGCATISDGLDAINPFASSGPKMAVLKPFAATAEARTQWSFSAGKARDYTFVPAIVGNAVYVAEADGSIYKLEDGKTIWRTKVGQPISAGVGASANLVVVGTAKGEVLAYSAENGSAKWQARVSSEVLAAPAIGADGVAVRSGDNRVFLFDLTDGGRKWVYQRATPTLSLRNTAPPIFGDRYVFVGFPGGKLVALGLQNGAPVWEGTVALPKGATELDRVADIVSLPVIDGTQVCAVAFLGLRAFTPMVAACPGCGRTTSTFFQELAGEVQDFVRAKMPEWKLQYDGAENMTLAVMGCIVNGPGESKHANIGISLPGTGEAPSAPVYEDGEKTVTLKGDNIANEFKQIIERYVARTYKKKLQA